MNPIYRSISSLDWITTLLIVSLILLSLGKYFYKSSFFSFIILPFNNKYIKFHSKKGKLLQGFHLVISAFQIINLALFFFIALSRFKSQPLHVYSDLYLILVGSILVFLLLKIGLQLLNGYFFENHGLMTEVVFEKLSYFNYGGFVAFFGNVLTIYVFPESVTLIYVIFLLIIVTNGIGMFKILRNLQKLIISNSFYFILYLCTLEISPIAIIISYLNS